MKRIVATLMLLSVFLFANAQYVKPTTSPGGDYHSHKGFHIELGFGPVFGSITDVAYQGGGVSTLKFSGTGIGIDFKIGGAIQENLVLTFDALSKDVFAPELTINGISYPSSNKLSVGEVSYGVGITYYLVPSDVFFSTTLGAGTFVIDFSNNGNSLTNRTDYGFSYQLRAGKHWWISNKWGIGLSAAYGSTSCKNTGIDSNGSYIEDLSSTRFIIAASIGLR